MTSEKVEAAVPFAVVRLKLECPDTVLVKAKVASPPSVFLTTINRPS